MYRPDTILALKEPRSTEEKAFAYDRVRVVGQSPVNHASISDEWTGAQGQGVIIQPLEDFGANLDRPYGELQQRYEVEFIPELEAPVAAAVKIIPQEGAGDSPEDFFAAEAAKNPQPVDPAHRRQRTPHDPLSETPEDPAIIAEREAVKERTRSGE